MEHDLINYNNFSSKTSNNTKKEKKIIAIINFTVFIMPLQEFLNYFN